MSRNFVIPANARIHDVSGTYWLTDAFWLMVYSRDGFPLSREWQGAMEGRARS